MRSVKVVRKNSSSTANSNSPLSKKRDYPSVKEKGKLSFLIVQYEIKLRIWQHLK